jgi:hypothetical protein
MRLLTNGMPIGLALGPVVGEQPMGGSSVRGSGRVRPDNARRAAHRSGNGAALTITVLALAGLPRRGKANPAPSAAGALAPVTRRVSDPARSCT